MLLVPVVVHKALLVPQDQQVHRELLVHLDLLDHQVSLVHRVHEAMMGQLQIQVLLVPLVLKVKWVLLVLQVQQPTQVQQELLVLELEPLGPLVQLVLEEYRVCKDYQALVLQEQLAQLV